MSIIKDLSVRHKIISGKYAGRMCSVYKKHSNPPKLISIILADCIYPSITVIPKKFISELKPPGWKDGIEKKPYGLEEYLTGHKGDGSNMLREKEFAQPRAMKIGDELASGELVTEHPRIGYNSSVLIHLRIPGWVELAPRLPVALRHNKKFKDPAELIMGEKLVTNCLIVRDSERQKNGWVNIFLDRREDRYIDVPFCIPLALA